MRERWADSAARAGQDDVWIERGAHGLSRLEGRAQAQLGSAQVGPSGDEFRGQARWRRRRQDVGQRLRLFDRRTWRRADQDRHGRPVLHQMLFEGRQGGLLLRNSSFRLRHLDRRDETKGPLHADQVEDPPLVRQRRPPRRQLLMGETDVPVEVAGRHDQCDASCACVLGDGPGGRVRRRCGRRQTPGDIGIKCDRKVRRIGRGRTDPLAGEIAGQRRPLIASDQLRCEARRSDPEPCLGEIAVTGQRQRHGGVQPRVAKGSPPICRDDALRLPGEGVRIAGGGVQKRLLKVTRATADREAESECNPVARESLGHAHSLASAATGSSRAAARAGRKPNTTPIRVEQVNAQTIELSE